MILATLVMNTQGNPRITKFYQNEVKIAPLSSHITAISQFLLWIVISSLLHAVIDDERATELR